ncbi:MAG: DivIVA domain-containing protein [Candidatus Eisenbacteria bacterium]|nr:DivIVA domain-containing protein [Candidatus Eisenbacteria bacterium]
MKISPLDIRKQTFRKALRGLDEQEVGGFLEMVAEQVERLVQENRDLRDRMNTLEVQLENYRRIEEALRNALVTAEKVARETKANTDQEVELRMKQADLRAQRTIQSARGILEGVRNDLTDLAKQRRDFLARFRLLVETQLKMLDLKRVEYEGDEDLRRLDEIQRALFDEIEAEGERIESEAVETVRGAVGEVDGERIPDRESVPGESPASYAPEPVDEER